MGNVHASSAPAPPPPAPPLPSSSTLPKLESFKPPQEVENPGALEEIHVKCKSKYRVGHNPKPCLILLHYRYIPCMFRRSSNHSPKRT